MNPNIVRPHTPQLRHGLVAAMLAAALCSAAPSLADEAPAPPPEVATEAALANLPVVIVNGRTITFAEVEAHAEKNQMPPDYALEELIDLQLLAAAATSRGVKLPPSPWTPETRAGLELSVARALGIEAAKARPMLVVDHAWLKDGETEKERAAGRALLEKLRSLVVKGATIPEAFASMQLDGTPWHIGDHEEYMAETIPPEGRDLPAGSISPIIPGDGGLQFFTIHQHKEYLSPADVIGPILRDQLRQGATIERP